MAMFNSYVSSPEGTRFNQFVPQSSLLCCGSQGQFDPRQAPRAFCHADQAPWKNGKYMVVSIHDRWPSVCPWDVCMSYMHFLTCVVVECVLIQLFVVLLILKPAGGNEWKRIGSQESVLKLIGDEMQMFLRHPKTLYKGIAWFD